MQHDPQHDPSSPGSAFDGPGAAGLALSGPPSLPAARSPRRRSTRRRWGAGLAALAVTGGLGAASTIPLPLVRMRPGAGIELNKTVVVEGETTPINGDYRGLTVRVDDLTPLEWMQVQLTRSDDEVLPRDEVFPPRTSRSDYDAQQRVVYADSARIAAAVAERALGLDVTVEASGAEVIDVTPGSAAETVLAPGDVIVGVARPGAAPTEIRLPSELRPALDAAGTDVELTVERHGTTTRSTLRVRLAPIPGTDRVGLGVAVQPARLTVGLPVEVTVDGGRVGGPSAGLLTALLVYDALSPDDLAGGRRITGTGTLELDGSVGPIGGIAEKARAALAADADVFVAPAVQAEEARAVVGSRLTVVGVHTFDEAVAALRTAPATAPADGSVAAGVTPTSSG